MNNQERLEKALNKIERNISLLEYVQDSVIEGSGIMRDDLFDEAVYEIILNLRGNLDIVNKVIGEYKKRNVANSKSWQFGLCKYLTNNEINVEQYGDICRVLDIPISELD